MDTYTRAERARYNAERELSCIRLGITKAQYNRFRRLAEKLHRIDEWSCNGTKQDLAPGYHWEAIKEYTDEEYARDERLVTETIAYQAGLLGLKSYHQGDPRGCSLYLDTVEIPENAYARAAAIY